MKFHVITFSQGKKSFRDCAENLSMSFALVAYAMRTEKNIFAYRTIFGEASHHHHHCQDIIEKIAKQ